MANFSIVWKLREKGSVVFRCDLEDQPSLAAAMETFRRQEPTAYVVRAYQHEPIDPEVLDAVLRHVELSAIARGWRSQ